MLKPKKKLSFVLLLALAFSFLPFISAVTLNSGTEINSSGGSSIVLGSTFNVSLLDVNSSSINFYDITGTAVMTAQNDSNLNFYNLVTQTVKYVNETIIHTSYTGNLTLLLSNGDTLIIEPYYSNPTFTSTCSSLTPQATTFFNSLIWIITFSAIIVVLIVTKFLLFNTSDIINFNDNKSNGNKANNSLLGWVKVIVFITTIILIILLFGLILSSLCTVV